MKKLLSLLLVLSLITTVFVGCGTDDKDGDSTAVTNTTAKAEDGDAEDIEPVGFVFNLGSEPKTFDPTLNSASDGGHLINNMFEGLTADTPEGIILAGAESIDVSDDGKVYTIKLRQDSKWSDGQAVTAYDYQYAWLRAMSADTASEYSFIVVPHFVNGAEYFAGEATAEEVGIKVLDEYTLEATLNYPLPYFEALLAFYTYYPVRQDVVEANPDTWFRDPATFVGNGPFVLSEYQTGSHLQMTPNPEYYGVDDIKVDYIKAVMIEEATTAHNAYLNGDIQINDMIPTEEIPTLQASDPYFISKPRVGTYYYIFNMDKEIMSDLRVRQALNLAIDRDDITDNVLKGGEIPAAGFVPGTLTDSTGASYRTGGIEFGVDPTQASVEEAQALLAAAGYPDGEGFPTLTLIYNTSESHKKVAEAVQEMWKINLNVDVELVNEEWAVFQDTRHDGKFDVARGGWLGDYADPVTMLDLWVSYSGNNDAQWRYDLDEVNAPHDTVLNPENEQYDQLIADSMTATGTDRDAILKEAERYLIEENQIVMPIYYYSYNYLVNEDYVVGIERASMGQWIFKGAEIVN